MMRLVKQLGVVLAALLVASLAAWLQFMFSDRLMRGLSIGSVNVSANPREAARRLRREADEWSGTSVRISVGQMAAPLSASRAELGASLPVNQAMEAARALGRTGNPLLDANTWISGLRHALHVRWLPRIDPERLGTFIDREQRHVERLPIAGTTDGQGSSLPGRDGTALDRAVAIALLQRALASSASQVTLPLQSIPAPPPIALGSPDGALFAGEAEEPATSPAPYAPAATPSGGAPEPRAWLPTNDDDCYAEPRHFCDGPRRAPAPFGPAQELATQLGLGKLETVARLIREGPSPAWIHAAHGPRDDDSLSWPVAEGRLGRGFGYVRRAELRDRIHPGMDIVAAQGSLVRAAAPGIVAYSDNRVRGYGNLLIIVHDSGAFTLSAHCERIFVFAGERVARDQVVAAVGMTGLAMGPHLHFEYHVGPEATDPAVHFLGNRAIASGP